MLYFSFSVRDLYPPPLRDNVPGVALGANVLLEH